MRRYKLRVSLNNKAYGGLELCRDVWYWFIVFLCNDFSVSLSYNTNYM